MCGVVQVRAGGGFNAQCKGPHLYMQHIQIVQHNPYLRHMGLFMGFQCSIHSQIIRSCYKFLKMHENTPKIKTNPSNPSRPEMFFWLHPILNINFGHIRNSPIWFLIDPSLGRCCFKIPHFAA